jgi:hypothetical protein
MFDRIARRQHEDGKGMTGAAQAAQQHHAILVRQAEVEHENADMACFQRVLRRPGGVDMIDGHRMEAQTGDDAACDKSIVLD